MNTCTGSLGRVVSSRTVIIVLLTHSLISTSALTRAADSWSFTTIDVPGAANSETVEANSLNSSGQIAGNFVGTDHTSHGFLRAPDGSFTTIDGPGTGGPGVHYSTYAYGINDAGQIVGRFAEHGFLRSANGTFTFIDAPNAGFTSAQGINNIGQIVGFFERREFVPNPTKHGFLRSADGAFTPIDVPDATETVPNSVGPTGQIAGYFVDMNGKTHGFLRNTAGVFTPFDAPDASATLAFGIDAAGQIVGYSVDVSAPGLDPLQRLLEVRRSHGFLRSATGAFTTIDVPGALHTWVKGINSAGQIVGGFLGERLLYHGFLGQRN